MKKCPGCQQDVDKHAIACQYCGRYIEAAHAPKDEGPPKTPPRDEKKDKNS